MFVTDATTTPPTYLVIPFPVPHWRAVILRVLRYRYYHNSFHSTLLTCSIPITVLPTTVISVPSPFSTFVLICSSMISVLSFYRSLFWWYGVFGIYHFDLPIVHYVIHFTTLLRYTDSTFWLPLFYISTIWYDSDSSVISLYFPISHSDTILIIHSPFTFLHHIPRSTEFLPFDISHFTMHS